jgi:hypothetical protein
MLVFQTYAVLGIPAPDETLPIYDYTVDIPLDDIDLMHITRLEPIAAAPPPQ